MTKNRLNKYKHSKRGLNQLLRLYERNYLKLVHLFPIADHEKNMVYLMPEGVLNKETKRDNNDKLINKITNNANNL